MIMQVPSGASDSRTCAQIVTSGGATAWQDLALYLITRFCGVEHAANTAKFWLLQTREASQAPFSVMPRGVPHDDGVVSECLLWIAGHYEHPNPIAAMIEQSSLPRTTFSRRFKHATGYRPMDYVHTLRTEEAKQMLEISVDAVDKIGRRVGYEDPASFRRIFKRKVGLTPSIYRRKFSRKHFERYNLMG
jgi:transcriptional regulator GlxA family with amidase domain